LQQLGDLARSYGELSAEQLQRFHGYGICNSGSQCGTETDSRGRPEIDGLLLSGEWVRVFSLTTTSGAYPVAYVFLVEIRGATYPVGMEDQICQPRQHGVCETEQ
jgi:hypothetical protein